MKVAWIGLGNMGLFSAVKVAAAGQTVTGYDVRPPAPGTAGGVVLVTSARAAVLNCDLVCIAVFSDAQVADVLTGPAGVFAMLAPGTVVAVFTTGTVETIREIAAAAPAGIAVLDTCFSRMHHDIATNTMTLLVGGEAEAIERCRPVFDAFARAIVHVGTAGSGRAIKLVNNILFAGHLQLAADALRFAQGLQLDPRATAAALTECSSESDIMRRFAQEDPAAMLETARRYMEKDVMAAADAAHGAGVDLGTLGAVVEVYRDRLPGGQR